MKIEWTELTAQEQTIAERVLNDIENGECEKDDWEIKCRIGRWDQEIGFYEPDEPVRYGKIYGYVVDTGMQIRGL